MLQSAGGDSGPLLVFLYALMLHVLECPAVPSSAQWGWEASAAAVVGPEKDVELLQSLSSGSPRVEAAGHWRIHNCLSSALCNPLLHSLLQMWYVCKVIGLHYLIYEVGVGGRVREDELK